MDETGRAPATADDGSSDPLEGDPRLQVFFGEAWPQVERFHRMLVEQGELRGLIGPREVARLWERHLLNSAAVVPFLPDAGVIVDVGSGAGLPGIVAAAMRPAADVVLVEPMERRTAWLEDVVAETGLTNVTVRRARAQELDGAIEADAVTARAVAALDKLFRLTVPLVRPGGLVVALKGSRARDELASAAAVMRRLRLTDGAVHEAPTLAGLEPTYVVTAVRGGSGGGVR
ncbi:16S rRNA (guanine(527)-N(7))-methyltransferase RsmG [Cellulomonas shaoxiangyii]|uniref:Ribosomal RNA small subunit methyltransferase G n=1 Tax=Cellulomonas shaoxiangyii TaxID=2566013 RepID=A0A4P7SNE4_9CELL|nr:16S rRNA (guanine(527)-N(7))-methyltransferase RsmG [Cellulomonas shaoxiangyii]QCB95057.1 16S rRNA (guanine(527)-N(7))-methyltransferase RsmG [Cellulomonas shaoxiangyii]TGY86386.1 16S rRNA (guanine(527)-N(7))-methyltransferase RsmG [Cellulomonas shaoxiangyii]